MGCCGTCVLSVVLIMVGILGLGFRSVFPFVFWLCLFVCFAASFYVCVLCSLRVLVFLFWNWLAVNS